MRHSHEASSVTWPILNLYKLSRSKLLYGIPKSKTLATWEKWAFPFIFCSIYFYLPINFWDSQSEGPGCPWLASPSEVSVQEVCPPTPDLHLQGESVKQKADFLFFLIKFSLVPWYKTSGLGCKLPLKRNYKMLHFSENQTKQGKTNGRKLNRQLVERVGEGKKKKIKIKPRHLT